MQISRGELSIRALVFDLDGLTVGSDAAQRQAWHETFLAYGTQLRTGDLADGDVPAEDESDPCDRLER